MNDYINKTTVDKEGRHSSCAGVFGMRWGSPSLAHCSQLQSHDSKDVSRGLLNYIQL